MKERAFIRLGLYSGLLVAQVGREKASHLMWNQIFNRLRARNAPTEMFVDILLFGYDRHVPEFDRYECGYWKDRT